MERKLKWDEEQAAILLQLYHWTCALCFGRAVCVHEIVPRSKQPEDLFDIENRVPLCNLCHRDVHESGTRKMAEKLRASRETLDALYEVTKAYQALGTK